MMYDANFHLNLSIKMIFQARNAKCEKENGDKKFSISILPIGNISSESNYKLKTSEMV